MLELKEFIANANKLFTLADICLHINSLVRDPNSSMDEIGRLVSHDPALAFRVLKLANSALYSHTNNIKTIEQALMKIGTDELCNIALATSAALVFRGVGQHRINLHDYWLHSVYSAMLARDIYQHYTKKNQGELFVAGLLHNIGLLVVLERLPYFAVSLADVVGREKKALQFETRTLGFSFSDVSSGLLKYWGIGDELVEIIGNQHLFNSQAEYKQQSLSLNCAITLADNLMHDTPEQQIDKIINQSTMEKLNMSNEKMHCIVEQCTDNALSIVNLING